MIKGHYGTSDTFNAEEDNLSSSSGLYDSSKNASPYIKESGKGKGIVYIVTGSAGYVGKYSYKFPYAAMYYSNDTQAGAAIIEVKENRSHFKWICADGIIRDQFTILKNVNKTTEMRIKKGDSITLTVSYIGNYIPHPCLVLEPCTLKNLK